MKNISLYINNNNTVNDIFVNVNSSKQKITSAWVHGTDYPKKVFGASSIVDDPYDVAPADAYNNWNYTLDDINNTITLNYYIGSETDVIVYANYKVNDKVMRTKIQSEIYGEPYMFNGSLTQSCRNIKSIMFMKGIDTTEMYICRYMFSNCVSLTKLEFNEFNTDNVTNMFGMFQSCLLLTSLDLSSFNTKKTKNMNSMFSYCNKLKIIYVNKNTWSTSQASVSGMFNGCGASSVTYV